jgi:hypothetical protein
MLRLADSIDMEEGLLAYQRYHEVMAQLARRFSIELEKVIAVFVSTSPNNDYHNNLRSTISILAGVMHGVPEERITISTYKHCRKRAYQYATGERVFLKETKGPKVLNFYHNILDPSDNNYVTIDGHMSAIWQGKKLTMKEALVTKKEYHEIAHAVKKLAFSEFMLPNQLQAVLWFTRKRVCNIKSENQFDLLMPKGDLWKTAKDVNKMKPFPLCLSSSTGTSSSSMELSYQGQLALDELTG